MALSRCIFQQSMSGMALLEMLALKQQESHWFALEVLTRLRQVEL